MKNTTKASVLTVFVFLLVFGVAGLAQGQSSGVQAIFDLESPARGPLPSDRYTVPDAGQNTGLRVNLPLPDCTVRRSDCEDLAVINTLDGFNLQPRLLVSFDGAIDVSSVSSDSVFLISLGSTLPGGKPAGRIVGINQVVWDTFTDTLHVESDELLDQHTRYALVVTSGVRGENGSAVQAGDAFRQFRERVQGSYKQALLDAIAAAKSLGIGESDIVAASVFTTQSATAILEKIRDQIKAATPAAANFNLGPGEERTVFPLTQVKKITFLPQTRANPPGFPPNPTVVPLNLLDIIPGSVGTIAFGKYNSPDYEVHPGEFIPPVGTRTGTPTVQGTNEIYFNLFLPSGPKPDAGWPVAIFGHGNSANKNNSFNFAATMAAHGIATIAINAVGAGFGPLGTLTVNQTGSEPVTFSAGGRGIDQNGDGRIEAPEGFASAPPRTIIFYTDGIRQTVADLMQLVRVIEVGVDVDGDGSPDLDRSRIYYFGVSLGGNVGTVFLGVETSVQAGVLVSFGGAIIENRRLGPDARPVLGQLLSSRMPPLINAPGITSLGGVSVGPPPHFNENFPLRDGIPLRVQLADGTSHDIQSPVINTVAGAIAIQEAVKSTEWVGQQGSPVAYAPHLRRDLLSGVPIKSVIYLFAKGDGGPNATATLRAGDLADRATFYRNDLAVAEDPSVPTNPHIFISRIADSVELARLIARGAQEQIATFFASDGQEVIHPEPARFFEVPIVLPLPEGLNFIIP